MKEKLLIVDGHNLLFQMFYGMPNKIYNEDNVPIHGVIGFIGALLKIIKINNPDYIVILFDKEQELDRKKINENYKDNRIDYSNVSDDENPFFSLKYIYKVLDLIKIKYTEVDTYEADDMIASYVFSYFGRYDIIISSQDSDFYSLINDSVNVFKYRGKKSELVTKEKIFEKYHIDSKYFADYKALIGDNSDNIKGVYGIGPKTATSLINNYGNIINIINNANEISNIKLRNKILDNISLLKENIELIKYTKTYELPFSIDELKLNIDENIKTMDLLKKCGIKKS